MIRCLYKNLPLLFLLTLLSSCQTINRSGRIDVGKSVKARASSEKIKKEWQKISKAKKKSSKKRLALVNNFIKANQGEQIVLEAYLLKDSLLVKQRKNKEACLNAQNLAQSPFHYKGSYPLFKKASQCFFNQKSDEKGFLVLEKFIRREEEEKKTRKKAAKVQNKFAEKRKIIKWTLLSLSHLYELSGSKEERKTYFEKGENLIDTLSAKDIKVRDSFYGIFQGEIAYKKAWLVFQKERDIKKSKKLFKEALSLPLSKAKKKEIEKILKLIKNLSRVNPYLIGVILPLSGKKKIFGQKVLRGLHLGFDLDKDSPWQLIVVDSKSHPDVVNEELENLFYKHNVMAFVGGLSSETAEEIARKAETFSVPSIVFSQKTDISLDRSFVFQNAVTAKQLVRPLAKQSVKKLDLKKVAILYPEDSHGKEYAKQFEEFFTEEGGEVDIKQVYKPEESDFKSAIKQMFQLELEEREEEYEKAKEAFLKKNPRVAPTSAKLLPENLLKPQIDFDAVFIPDSTWQLKKIVDHFKYFGVKDLYLLGTNLWDPKNITKASSDFPVAFVSLSKINKKKVPQFYKDFYKLYAYAPGIFERRAGDAALFLKKGLEKSSRTRLGLLKALQDIKKFDGAFSPVSLSSDRVFEPSLSFYQNSLEKKQLKSRQIQSKE